MSTGLSSFSKAQAQLQHFTIPMPLNGFHLGWGLRESDVIIDADTLDKDFEILEAVAIKCNNYLHKSV